MFAESDNSNMSKAGYLDILLNRDVRRDGPYRVCKFRRQ